MMRSSFMQKLVRVFVPSDEADDTSSKQETAKPTETSDTSIPGLKSSVNKGVVEFDSLVACKTTATNASGHRAQTNRLLVSRVGET